jgi:hypothetical protein
MYFVFLFSNHLMSLLGDSLNREAQLRGICIFLTPSSKIEVTPQIWKKDLSFIFPSELSSRGCPTDIS